MWANKSTYRKYTVTSLILLCTVSYFDHFQDYLIVVHELADAGVVLVVCHVKLDVLIHFPFLIREGSHGIPDPRNQDLTAGADQCV